MKSYDKKSLFSSTVIASAAVMTLAASPAFAQATQPVPGQPTQPPAAQGPGMQSAPAPTTRPGQAPRPGQTPDEEAVEGSIQQGAPDAEAQDDAATDGTVEAVVVTGSRIRRNEFTSSAPIQVITAEQATLEGLVDTAEILQQSSVASGSFQVNSQTTGLLSFGTEQVTAGANYISLRGLGSNRTLVLVNGRRAGPAGISGAVGPFDLNVIPPSVIERQEILKSGASSVYGSDAVAGVVNIITKRNLDGGELTIYGNVPERGSREIYQANGSFGKTFDRAYFTVSGDVYKRNPLSRGDRDYLRCTEDVFFNPSTGERRDRRLANGDFVCNNITANTLQVVDNVQNAVLVFPEAGRDYGTPQQGNNSLYPGLARVNRAGFNTTFQNADQYLDDELYAQGQVFQPLNRYSVFATAGYKLSPGIELYAELLGSRRETETNQISNLVPANVTAPTLGIQLNQTVGGLPANNPNNRRPDGTSFGFLVTTFIPRTLFASQQVDYTRGVVGARGTFSENFSFLGGWDWDVYTQRSHSEGTYNTEFVYTDRLAAVSAPLVACTNTPANIGNISGFDCAKVNGGAGIPWTSQRIVNGDLNQEERDFLFGNNTGMTTYDQTSVEASVTGDLMTLPAGALGVALGAHWRKDEINDNPGPNALARNMYNFSASGITAGQDTVREFFGEFDAPLLRNIPFFQSLGITASARYSDYESYGSSTTYSAGLNWQIIPALRVRATTGTSFRAPSLFEQFIGNRTGFQGQGIDPCVNYQNSTDPLIRANCAKAGVPENYTGVGVPAAVVVTGGGRDVLEPETSESRVYGVIWTPRFIDLSVALDYYEFDIQDEIRQFGAGNILSQCYSDADFPNSPFCSLFVRNPTPTPTNFGIVTVNNSFVNVAAQTLRGLDLTTRYEHELPFADFTFDGQFTWTFEDEVELIGGVLEDKNGFQNEPDFTGNLTFRFTRNDWTLFWNVDLLGKASDVEAGYGFGTDIATSNAVFDVTCTFRTGVAPPAGTPDTRPTAVGACPSFLNAAGANAVTGTLTVNTLPVYRKLFQEFQSYHHVSLTRRMDDWTFRAGVQNLFDEEPPLAGSGEARFGTAAAYLYDLVGRRYFASVSKRW